MTRQSPPYVASYQLSFAPFDWSHIESQTTIDILVLSPVDWPRGNYTVRAYEGDPGYAPKVAHAITGVPPAAIRNQRDFVKTCSRHLSAIRATIQGAWALSIELHIGIEFFRARLQERTGTHATGPFTEEDLDQFADLAMTAADNAWVMQQVLLLGHREVETTAGHQLQELNDLYRTWWAEKDGPNALHTEMLLVRRYAPLARAAMKNGDLATAAEFSLLAIDLLASACAQGVAPAQLARHSLKQEFGALSSEWRRVQVARDNALGRLEIAAAEGTAVWRSFLGHRFFVSGHVSPMTRALRDELACGTGDSHARIHSLSAENPYREGFEVVDTIVGKFGFWMNFVVAVITRWPANVLARKTTLQYATKAITASTLRPDARLRRIACVPTRLNARAIEALRDVFDDLDRGLPSIHAMALAAAPEEA